MKKKYEFGEKEYEKNYSGKKVPVTMTPKYKQTKENVISLLESDQYKGVLNDSDFWILKNYDKAQENCYYTGLIISHDALVKVNETLPENERFSERFCSDPIVCSWKGSEVLRMDYRDNRDGMYEVGEISASNCKNEYPFAMLLKRTFDRVVKRKAKLSMVYSDSEADEFRETQVKKDPLATEEQVKRIVDYREVIMDELVQRGINGTEDVMRLSIKEASYLCKLIEDRLNG